MKNMKKSRKNIIIAAVSTLAAAILIAGVTLALYTTRTEGTVNTFTVGNVTTEIIEIFNKINDHEYQKEPCVTNTGENSCYIRMRAAITPEDALANLDINYDTRNWEKKGEWYYYKNEVAPGESTTPLFTRVNVDYNETDKPWIDFDIILYQEAVQSSVMNNGTLITDRDTIWNLYNGQ